MKQCISFEATAKQSTGGLLLHVAILLRQMRINPLEFAWTGTEDREEVSAWMLVIHEETRVRELVGALIATDGVRNVVASIETPPVAPINQVGPDSPPARMD
jgi:hypothetical protein